MSTEIIKHNDKILAILAKTAQINDNLKFISPEEFPLQVGIHNKGEKVLIGAHEHFPFININKLDCQEIFYLQKGKLEIGLYYGEKKVCTRTMEPGDIIILNSGHDIKFLEDSKMIEIKQGPYRGRENEKRDIETK